MIKKILFSLLILSSFFGFSQETANDSIPSENSSIVTIRGQIVDGVNKKPLTGAHVFNMNTIRGSITNAEGYFEVPAKANDTLFLSHLGFQSLKIKITYDVTKHSQLLLMGELESV